MLLLRRSALRVLSAAPSYQPLQVRTFVARSGQNIRIASQLPNKGLYRRFASSDVSARDRELQDEPPQTEPSAAEQEEIKEESIATSDVADAAAKENVRDIESEVRSAASAVGEAAQNAAQTISSNISSALEDNESRLGDEVKPSKIIFVGNLAYETTNQELQDHFQQFGKIESCRVGKDARGMSRGFAHVEFEDLDAAKAAIRDFDQTVLQGRRMLIQYHRRREPRRLERPNTNNPPSKCLFIGNMSFSMTDQELNDLFRKVKNVLDVRVAIDRKTGQPRGFAHADFVDVESAEKARTELTGMQIHGRELRIDFSLSQSQRSKRGQGETTE